LSDLLRKERSLPQVYASVLIPAVESALKKRNEIRFLYHLGPDFSGFNARAI
jgi:hypothetical protein